jgi:hypothetical protein
MTSNGSLEAKPDSADQVGFACRQEIIKRR